MKSIIDNSREDKVVMKVVYELSKDLDTNPDYVAKIQALTLDESKPFLGLKGTYGLFGSKEWWNNIKDGILPTKHCSGVITRIYYAGQDSLRKPNSFDLMDNIGSIRMESFYANNKDDYSLYKVGHKVNILYVLDELKKIDGNNKFLETVLEISVSLQSIGN